MNALIRLATVAALTALMSPAAFANLELAQKRNCMACHAAERKIVGPSFKEIAVKYAKDKKAEAYLAEKIVKGGKGVWGEIPMPGNPQVSAEEAKVLAKWILTGK